VWGPPHVRGKMIEIHHFYNKFTTALSYRVGPTHCEAHPIWESCCKLVVKVMYENQFSCERDVVPLLYMWCTGITSLINIPAHLLKEIFITLVKLC